MVETRVGHTRHDECDIYAGRGNGRAWFGNVAIGERGWLGNPFRVERYGREMCVSMFRSKFERVVASDPDYREAVRELAGKTLGCWCQRLDDDGPPCHAEVVAEWADRLAAEADG